LRAKTKEVYEALCEAHQETGIPPTIRLLVSKLGLTEEGFVSVVYYALQDLVEMGLVEKRMPVTAGLYVPMLPPDRVDWETLEGGNSDGRETLEGS
jgi:predicted transcriptional regulator